MKVYACVITYHPDEQLLRKNISQYQGLVDKVVIWENTPVEERKKIDFSGTDNISVMENEGNKGISIPLNQMLRLCEQEDVDYLLTMDQDSLFVDFDKHLKNSLSFFKENKNTIAIGPEVNSDKIGSGKYEERNYLITSGAIVDVRKATEIGGYTEKHFVDAIDIDFGYKALKHNYKCYCMGGSILQQSYGNTVNVKGIQSASYPPSRLTPIVKGYWQVIIDYFPKTLPLILELINKYYFRKPIAILLFQKDKLAKLKAITKGSIQGIKYIFHK